MPFLSLNKSDMLARGIEQFDFIYVSGDAYIDHPSFGVAIITRIIESYGFSVGIIAQPQSEEDFAKFGEPKFAFFVGSGVVDSMVNNYTVAKKKRKNDVYSEGGDFGKRPDRCLIVYCKMLRKLFGDTPIIIGGIEASLRRFAHYDYWSNSVMNSIIVDCGADLLIYGMGEKPLFDICELAKRQIPLKNLTNVEGTVYCRTFENLPKKVQSDITSGNRYIFLPSCEEVKKDKIKFIEAFNIQSQNTDNLNASPLIQKCSNFYIVQNIPCKRLSEKEMDRVYALPYERAVHPSYTRGVPAIQEVEFSVNSHRGCFGNCSFCAIAYHQGRAVQHRSEESILEEVKNITKSPNFKGYIHDIGGPSANFYNPSCDNQLKCGICKNKQCIGTTPCPNLKISHLDYLQILQKARKIEGVKKVFVRSGIRFDYVMYDGNKQFFDELCKYHISGQLKVAPEHISNKVLEVMNKPRNYLYEQFKKEFEKKNEKLDSKQYLVPYYISSHPGCRLEDAVELALQMKKDKFIPKQVQDFYPTPSTKATTMFYTGINPDTMQPIYVPRSNLEKAYQRALLQYNNPNNYNLVVEALQSIGREDLIGYGEMCLVRPKSLFAKNYKRYKK